ncbi:unnamed protein product, partial [Ectocarpus sp. 4 AP-2014]
EQHRRRGAERQWARLLDERSRLAAAGLRAEAAEEARIAPKGSAGAHEHAALGARLLAALSSDLKGVGGKSCASEEEAVLTAEEARATVGRLAFQAFDRDGNGVLDVSDLADLLGVLRRIAGRPPSARTAAGSGAAAAGYGLEAAVIAMDEDHSGQVDIDEFMRWFNGYDAHDGANRSTAPGELPQRGRESEEPLYVKVLGVRNGATGRTNAQHECEANHEEDADDAGSGSDSSGGGSDSSSLSSVSASTADGDDAVGARASGNPKSAKNEKRPAAEGVFRVRAWLRRKAPATTNGSQRKKTKRKRWDEKEEEQEEDASKPTDDGDSERGRSGAKKRRRPSVGGSNTGDGSLASPSSANHSVAEARARGAPFSPRRLLGDRWSSSTADPWKRHAETLRAVAEQEARTLLLRRARLRAHVYELARFRATRPPEYDEWSSPDFLEKHGQTVSEMTADADAIFVETLHRNLRKAEEAVQHGLSKERSAQSPLPPPDPGICTTTATTAAAAAALRSDGSGNLETAIGVDGGSAGALASAPSPSPFAWSLGGRKWWGRRGGGRGTGIQAHAPGTWGERQPDIAETIKAAERDAAAARRRAFQTPTGRVEIARAVRRLKASRVIASTSNTAAVAAEAGGEAPQTNTAQGTHEERHTAVTQVAAAGAVSGGATWGAPANAGLSEDAGARHTASVARLSTSNDVAGAVDRVAEREKRSPLVEQAEQLFQLFDADGSGAIDREELAPLLRQLGIWVTAKMASELFPRLDLDCSGDIRQEELVMWLENEGANRRRLPLSKMLRAGQTVKAGGSSTRRLESQVRASIVARSRAAARAEVWASLGVTPPPAAASAKMATTASAAAIDGPQEQAKQEDPSPQKQQQHQQRGEEEKKVVDEEAVVVEAATARNEPALGVEVTGGKERGRVLATRAAGRRRRFEEEERDTEWELVVKRAEGVAERRIKRQWRTQAGAAELKRERDRICGAEEALNLTLRAWDAGIGFAKEEAGVTMTDASALRETKRAEEKLRHMFRLFDVSCDGCIDAEELGRLLSRMNVPMSETEIVGLLHEMDRQVTVDGSGDVDFCEFSAWWHKDGLKRSQRPAALIRSAVSSLVAKVAPITAARRDARRALISRARAEARAEVKNLLRLEDKNEEALRLAKTATGNTASAVAADAAGEYFEAFETRVGREYGGTSSAPPGKPLLKDGTEGLGREGSGVDDGGEGRGDRLNAKRLAAARSSKLARAEAEAYADVQAMILTQAGKRELARRTRDLRLEWSAVIRTATRIARESGSGELGTAGSVDYSYEGASHDKEEQRTQRKEQQQHATTTDTSGIPLVEAPILRFLWGLHGSTTAGASAGVEPSELKYVGASLRSTLVGGANRRVWGSQQATLLGSTLAKGTTGRTANIVRTSADFGPPPQAEEEATSPNAARTASVESGDALSLSKIFDDHADDEIRNLKTLTRVDLADVLASLHRPSSPALANSAGSAADDERRSRTKGQVRADLATIAKLKLKLFFTPGAFRKLAKQAMLAEGRAFERYELARAIALEDGEPWRLAEVTGTKRSIESAGGATPADVDRLRAMTMGAAKLGRALAQGEELAAAECRSFLKTSAGREELRATTAAVRDQRRQQQQHTAARTAAAVDPGRESMVGVRIIRRIASATNNLARDELRRAFALCEADGVPGEISRAEAAHVLSFAGIPQTTLAATGRVRVPLQKESKHSGGQPSQTPKSQRRRRRQRRWPWRGRHAEGPSGSQPPPGRQGTPPPRLPRNAVSRFLKIGRGAGPGGAKKQGNTGTGGNARVCPTNEDDGDDNARVVSPIVVGPESPPSQAGEKEDRGDELDGEGGDACIGGEEDDGRESDDHGSDGQFSVDIGMVDDVTNDEGFELGEMEILLAAVKARQTLAAKAASLGRLLARRVLPSSFTDTRDARMLLMSRARSAGRDKAMHKFENLLTVETGDLFSASTHQHE